MSVVLLPCPFCGSSARIAIEIDDDGFDVTDEPERWVQCENRDCRGRSDWSYDPDMAVKWWNTRPSTQAVAVDGAWEAIRSFIANDETIRANAKAALQAALLPIAGITHGTDEGGGDE